MKDILKTLEVVGIAGLICVQRENAIIIYIILPRGTGDHLPSNGVRVFLMKPLKKAPLSHSKKIKKYYKKKQ